jgi:hypothetical protein
VTEPPKETPHGLLYAPAKQGRQLLNFVGAFIASILVGFIPRLAFGELSDAARTLLHVPFVLVFAFGYAGWAARLQALGVELLGRSLFKVLLQLILFRRKPRSLADVIPDRDKFLQLAVRGQKAASSFFIASFPVALLSAFAVLFIKTELGWFLRIPVIVVLVVLWGWWLMRLGRRGHLPFPEPGE